MGTRADFYVRKEKQMEWIGSKGFDGYPDGIKKEVLQSVSEDDYRANVESFFAENDDVSRPEEGWPWPWNDSRTTDYSYIFEDGKVMASCFGYPLFDPLKEESEDEKDEQKMEGYFPDMSDIKNVKLGGKASGMIVVSANGDGSIDVK